MDGAIHIDDVVVRIANHDVARHVIQRLSDTRIFRSLLALDFETLLLACFLNLDPQSQKIDLLLSHIHRYFPQRTPY